MQNMNQLQIDNTQELSDVNHSTHKTIRENERAKIALNATVNSIQEIQKTSEQISNIISIIDSIAFQTNLLALNAAVEAARAGEHGRGFAVVAGEVRSLAQKSADAAREIKSLINTSVEKVNEGVLKVQETHEAFESVDESVSYIGTAMQSVLASIQEQQHSVREIAQALNLLDGNIQNNATLVEQSSAASHSLKEQAALLNHETDKFVIDQQKAYKFIQNTPAVFGVDMAEVRQKMRIWRTNIQTYLNGIPSNVDLATSIDPNACSVGQNLSILLSNLPGLNDLPEFKRIDELHVLQHDLVKEALRILENASELNLQDLQMKDKILDQFSTVTDDLDDALGNLNDAITVNFAHIPNLHSVQHNYALLH